MTTTTLTAEVRRVVADVSDPEFPGVSIDHLGILESVEVDDDGRARVRLLPTFLGCPALGVIADDVAAAASSVSGVVDVQVEFRSDPVWTPDRISAAGRRLLAEEFTVAVRAARRLVTCPVCGSRNVSEVSPFGPTACRAIAYCPDCRNPLEVMRQ